VEEQQNLPSVFDITQHFHFKTSSQWSSKFTNKDNSRDLPNGVKCSCDLWSGIGEWAREDHPPPLLGKQTPKPAPPPLESCKNPLKIGGIENSLWIWSWFLKTGTGQLFSGLCLSIERDTNLSESDYYYNLLIREKSSIESAISYKGWL
jgi:hypothetical protein